MGSEEPRWLRATWWLLLVVAAFTVVFPLLDVAGILRSGIPSDHAAAFRALAGADFSSMRTSGPAHYISQLEYGYAVHELVFGLLFVVVVLVPFRRGEWWAWWACWIPLIGYAGYTVTFAHFATATLAYSLVPDVALPVLLLVQLRRFRAPRSLRV
jgi:hypothetical protein